MFEHQWSRVVFTAIALTTTLAVGGCDGKSSTPSTPSIGDVPSSGVSRTTATPDSFPTGIVPVNAGVKVDVGAGKKLDSNKGPADGAAAIGGLTGNSNSGATKVPPESGTPAPTAGDGTAPPAAAKP